LKLTALCVCDDIKPLENRIFVLILQHPQEQDRALGTARLTTQSLTHAQLKIGLSWPGLSKLLGRPVDPSRWAVLYLGSFRAAQAPTGHSVLVLDKGQVKSDQLLDDVEGLVLLDGTWSQAKALWWRNPWLLKCRRVVLAPPHPSLYGRLRREPRREGLSTIEAAATLLEALENRPELASGLIANFQRMLQKYRTSGAVERPGQPGRKQRRVRRH
jgi:DTW domain-containing protein YfiP